MVIDRVLSFKARFSSYVAMKIWDVQYLIDINLILTWAGNSNDAPYSL